MDTVLTLMGIMVIALGLWDMFRGLLNPKDQGVLSRLVFVGAWRLSKAVGHRFGSAVGPASMVIVILLWVLQQGVGWALIYLPHVPEGFTYSPGVHPTDYPDVLEALYFSFVTLSTLGFGDIVPTDPWIRGLAPFQALTGFALLTSALMWFGQVHPLLSHRRALALTLKGLNDAGYAGAIGEIEPGGVARVLDDLTGEVILASIDLVHYAESFYFQDDDPRHSLARQLPYALELRDAAADSPSPEVRMSASRLAAALTELSAALAEDFVSGEDIEEVFRAYHSAHGRSPRTGKPDRGPTGNRGE